jgi:hypothetical protein
MYLKAHRYAGWHDLRQFARQYAGKAAALWVILTIAIWTAVATPPALGIVGFILVAIAMLALTLMVYLLGFLRAIDRYHAEILADVRSQEHVLLASIAANTQQLLDQEDLDGTATDAGWIDTSDGRSGNAR